MGVGLYIHIPFCRRKCYYCDFVSIDLEKKPDAVYSIVPYIDALEKEAQAYRSREIKSIYIGGGTPTVLEGSQLNTILQFCYTFFKVSSSAEITIEANPGTLGEKKLLDLKSSGFNRLSIGLQSFNNTMLKKIGRIHSAGEFLSNFRCARIIGFDNINVDMIFALPEQTLADFKIDIEQLLNLRPEHISVYCLTIEKETRLWDEIQLGNISACDNDLEAEMYSYAINTLKKAGYIHYEISNFALPGFESRHNRIYWQNEEYIGIGASATSYLYDTRFTNINDPEQYIHALRNNGNLVAYKENLNHTQKLSETVVLGLRMMKGIKMTDEISARFYKTIQDLTEKKLLFIDNQYLKLTNKGILLANQVFIEFLP